MKRACTTDRPSKRRASPCETYTCAKCPKTSTLCTEGNLYEDGTFLCVDCIDSDAPNSAVAVLCISAGIVTKGGVLCSYSAIADGDGTWTARPSIPWSSCALADVCSIDGAFEESVVVDPKLRCERCDGPFDRETREKVMVPWVAGPSIIHHGCLKRCFVCNEGIFDVHDAECDGSRWLCSSCCIGRCDGCGEEMRFDTETPHDMGDGERLCDRCYHKENNEEGDDDDD